MGFVICRRCKFTGYCTFASSGSVSDCDEFEEQDSAEAFEWNLQDLQKLVTTEREEHQDAPDG